MLKIIKNYKFRIINTNDIYFSLINISFFLMLFLPTRFQFQRGILILIIGLYTFVNYSNLKPKLARSVFLSSLICLINSSISIIIGLFNNNPGLIPSITTGLIWPLFFIWIIACNKSIKALDNLMKVFIFVFIFNSIFLTILIVNILNPNLFNYVELIKEIFDFRVSFEDGEIAFNIISMGTFIFANGYFFSRIYYFNSSSVISKKDKIINIFLYLASIIILLISGRRGFVLAGIISALLTMIIFHLTKIKLLTKSIIFRLISCFTLIIIISIFYLLLNGTDLYLFSLKVLEDFNIFDLELLSYKRYDDIINLTNLFKTSPIFGSGFGFSISPPTVITQQIYSYEVQYLQFLTAFGIFGFSIYASYLYWIFYKLINISKKNNSYSYRLLPLLSGLISMLIANATNPYLIKFDFLWVIFIPIAYINVLSIKK